MSVSSKALQAKYLGQFCESGKIRFDIVFGKHYIDRVRATL